MLIWSNQIYFYLFKVGTRNTIFRSMRNSVPFDYCWYCPTVLLRKIAVLAALSVFLLFSHCSVVLMDGGRAWWLKHRKLSAAPNSETTSSVTWYWHWPNFSCPGPRMEKYWGRSNSFYQCNLCFGQSIFLRHTFLMLWLSALTSSENSVTSQQNM